MARAILLNESAWISDYQRWLSESESLHNAQLVANHFSGTDWTKESIAAMCGNMRHESSINPNMYEYGYDWSQDRGFGLVQWTPRSKYWDWAVAMGLSPREGDSQLARIDYEVDNNIQWIPRLEIENLTFKEFRTNARGWTVNELTEAFTWGYERPNREAGESSMPARQAFATTVFNEVDFEGGTSPGNPGEPWRTGTGTGSSGIPATSQYKYEKEGTLNNMTYVQVKKGDTLSAIAKKHGISMDGIKRVSYEDIRNKNRISQGEVLLLPKATKKPTPAKSKTITYTIKKGDNLTSIAKKHKTTVAAITKKNNIKDPNKIYPGQRLKI